MPTDWLDRTLAEISLKLELCVTREASEESTRRIADVLSDIAWIRDRLQSDAGRRTDRRMVQPSLAIWNTKEGTAIDCGIEDVSAGGAKLTLPSVDVEPEQTGTIHLAFFARPIDAKILAVEDGVARIQFLDLTADEKAYLQSEVQNSLLRYMAPHIDAKDQR